MPTLIQLAKSKSILFASGIFSTGLVGAIVGNLHLNPMQQSIALMVIGVVTAVLRFITTVPLAEK